jgi:hypothetical protein
MSGETPLAASIAAALDDRDIVERTAAEEFGDALDGGLNVFAHKGCERLNDLLGTLSMVFPENSKLSMWLTLFTSTILNNSEREKWAMERWHREMTTNPDGSEREPSLYEKVKARDVASLLASGVWILDEIDATAMYNDPELDDDDREHICRHFERVNACAEWMATMPADMMDCVLQAVSKMDLSQPITPETMFPIVQQTLGLNLKTGEGADADVMERIIGWTSKMMKLLSSGGLQSLLSIVGEAAALAGTSMPDMAAVMQSMQTEIMGCGELLSHSTDSADEAQLGLMNDVLKGLSGSV